MKLCIAGSRTLTPSIKEIDYVLNKHLPNIEISEVVSGTAKGADKVGEKFADHFMYNKKLFPADWKRNGKAAGPIRNEIMAKYCDMAMIWWDGESKGTFNMICNLDKLLKPYILCIIKDGKFESKFIDHKISTLY